MDWNSFNPKWQQTPGKQKCQSSKTFTHKYRAPVLIWVRDKKDHMKSVRNQLAMKIFSRYYNKIYTGNRWNFLSRFDGEKRKKVIHFFLHPLPKDQINFYISYLLLFIYNLHCLSFLINLSLSHKKRQLNCRTTVERPTRRKDSSAITTGG